MLNQIHVNITYIKRCSVTHIMNKYLFTNNIQYINIYYGKPDSCQYNNYYMPKTLSTRIIYRWGPVHKHVRCTRFHVNILRKTVSFYNKGAMRPWIAHLRMGFLRLKSFSANGNIIKTNFLTKVQAAQVKNAISIVLKEFLYNMAY